MGSRGVWSLPVWVSIECISVGSFQRYGIPNECILSHTLILLFDPLDVLVSSPRAERRDYV
jgi:hypothetical protein